MKKLKSPKQEGLISRRQFLSICFIALLSPVMRRVPSYSVKYAGTAAWLAPLAALVPCALCCWVICWFLSKREEHEGLGDIILRALGNGFGKVVLAIIALWLIFFGGTVVRFGVDRLRTTIYPDIKPTGFSILMFLSLLPVTMGELRALARLSSVFRPVIILMLSLIFIFVLPDIHPENLLPVSRLDVMPLLTSVPHNVNIASSGLFFAFLMDRVERREGSSFPALAGFGAGMFACITLVIVTTVSTFGAMLTEKFSNPFFAMVRNISILGTVERIEAIIAGLWVVVDFIMAASLFSIIVTLLFLIFPGIDRRLAGLLSVALPAVVCLSIPSNIFKLEELGLGFIPISGAVVLFVIIFGAGFIGKIRRKI